MAQTIRMKKKQVKEKNHVQVASIFHSSLPKQKIIDSGSATGLISLPVLLTSGIPKEIVVNNLQNSDEEDQSSLFSSKDEDEESEDENDDGFYDENLSEEQLELEQDFDDNSKEGREKLVNHFSDTLAKQGCKTNRERHELARTRVSRAESLDRKRKKNVTAEKQSGKKKKTNFNKTDPPSVQAKHRLVQYPKEHFRVYQSSLRCDACNVPVSVKKSSIDQHIESAGHQKKKKELLVGNKPVFSNKIETFVKQCQEDRKLAGEGFSIQLDVETYRMKTCYAILQDGIPFSFLKDPAPKTGLRHILEDKRFTLPHREVRDCITKVLKLEFQEILNELTGIEYVSIIFDGTPHVAEVFGVVLRFVVNSPTGYKITHRLVALRFYKYSFTGSQLALAISDILLLECGIKRSQIRSATCDGCPTNGLAMEFLSGAVMFPHLTALTCISHSSNVVGKIMMRKENCPLPLARQFESWWSHLMSTCPRARTLFRENSGVSVVRSSEIRWFCWYEIINQVYVHAVAVRAVITSNEDFGSELRNNLNTLLAEGTVQDLRMELAIARDFGANIVKLCYFQEGDDPLLCATTFDHWNAVQDRLRVLTDTDTSTDDKALLLPSVTEWATALSNNNQDRKKHMIQQSTLRMIPMYEKMFADSHGRLENTLKIFRACRMFDYKFVAKTALEALIGEIVHVSAIPICYDNLRKLEAELRLYKQRSYLSAALDPSPTLWQFWSTHSLELPTFWICVQEVALITPSSCTVERVFSLLTQGFDDSQEGSLEDLVFASIMIRYNNNWRKKDLE